MADIFLHQQGKMVRVHFVDPISGGGI